MGPMLHDRARIHVQAGAGGDGCRASAAKPMCPRGGPDGGDGGRGGDVVLVCDDSLRDLQGFRRRSHFRAGRGGHGEGSLRHGADGETLIIRVPPGTQIVACEEDGVDLEGRRWELLAAGQRAPAASGGSGGKGNKRFATATRQAPRFAERGLAGEEGWLELQLKLLADVGLVGLPNAGKSSLLSRLTRAAPKIADYPFTTLSPVLGVLEGRRAPADRRRHPRADRGRKRGRRPRPRLPRPCRAHAAAGARARPRARARPGARERTRPSTTPRSSASWPRTTRASRAAARARALQGRPRRRGARPSAVAEWQRAARDPRCR